MFQAAWLDITYSMTKKFGDICNTKIDDNINKALC